MKLNRIDACAGLMLGGFILAALLIPVSESPAQSRQKSRGEHLVETVAVTRDTLRTTTVYTGSLKSRRKVRIFNREEGRITRLPFFEGDQVTQGDVLLELDDRLLRAERDKALALRREAETVLGRYTKLKGRTLVSEDEILKAKTQFDVYGAEVRAIEARIEYTRETAPFDGVVATRLAEPGDVVSRHTHILTIIDPSTLITELNVSEMVLPHVQLGQLVRVRIDALGEADYAGSVLRIHPELNARTRQGRVEIEIENPPAQSKPGQFARVSFDIAALDRMVIPFSALRRDRAGEYVFRLEDDLRVKRINVRSGRRLADSVEILEGLAVGDEVVVRGFLGLTANMRVKPTGQRNRAVAGESGEMPDS